MFVTASTIGKLVPKQVCKRAHWFVIRVYFSRVYFFLLSRSFDTNFSYSKYRGSHFTDEYKKNTKVFDFYEVELKSILFLVKDPRIVRCTF